MAAQKVAEQTMPTQVLGDFDPLVIHHRDPVSKRLVKTNPYKLHIVDGIRYFEHPKGSGNLWYEDRTHAGRYEAGKVIKGAAHKAYVAPLTQDEILARDISTTKQENERLLKELAEIKKELAAKTTTKPSEAKA